MQESQVKQAAAKNLIDTAKQYASEGVDREKLEVIKGALLDRAARKNWWDEKHYPGPGSDEIQTRYLIAGAGERHAGLVSRRLAVGASVGSNLSGRHQRPES